MTTDSNSKKLGDHKVLIFDVYGTLADWETGLYTALEPLLSRYPVSASWSRKDALTAFGSVETDLQAQHPDMLYSDLLAKVHEVLEERLKVLSEESRGGPVSTTPPEGSSSSEAASTSTTNPSTSIAGDDKMKDEHKAFGASIPNWPIFHDTTSALHRLSKHFKLVVLSNIDRDSFRHTHLLLSEGPQPATSSISHSKLDFYTCPDPNPNQFWHPCETEGTKTPFTLVLTAQDVGCYKPALGGFQTALRYIRDHPKLFGEVSDKADLDGVRERTLSVAQSLPHDHVPAARLGMRSVWIDRQSAVTCNEVGGGAGTWTWRFETLGEMADAVEMEAYDKEKDRV